MTNGFSKRLNSVRKPWGTLEALAERVGTSYNTLQAWETKPPKKIDANLLAKISSVLDVDMTWLLTGEGPAHPGKNNIDTGPSNNVGSTVSEQELEEGEVNAKYTIEAQAETIELLKEKISKLEEENQLLREKKRAVQGK